MSGSEIRKLRKRVYLTQYELAAQCQTRQTFISQLENNMPVSESTRKRVIDTLLQLQRQQSTAA